VTSPTIHQEKIHTFFAHAPYFSVSSSTYIQFNDAVTYEESVFFIKDKTKD